MRRPLKRPTMEFRRGQSVEVSIQDDGFAGSYYEATVVSRLDAALYVVRYTTLLEDDESQPLSETVYSHELRPLPPAVPVPAGFYLHQKVDAFDNDGWWVGVVAGKSGPDNAIYDVYFEATWQCIAYPVSTLRVHQDWIAGKWVFPKKLQFQIQS